MPAPAKPEIASANGRSWKRSTMAVGFAAATLIAATAFVAYQMTSRSKTISMVAVLPFENATGNPANDYLSNGISESLINKLSNLSGLHVISRTSAFALKGKTINSRHSHSARFAAQHQHRASQSQRFHTTVGRPL